MVIGAIHRRTMGLCKKNYITIGRGDNKRKVFTKGKTLEEIDREIANIKLELSDYRSVS